MAASVLWFRRDLRLADNPALVAAAGGGRPVVGLFVLDDRLRLPSGANRLAFLYRALRSLDRRLGGRLVVRTGNPVEVVPGVAAEAGAGTVVCTADFGPYGRRRDQAVAVRLAEAGRRLEPVGSPYAVAPGTVVKSDGSPYRVFTPYYREWARHLEPEWLAAPEADWVHLPSDGIPDDPAVTARLPDATEAAAHERLERFLAQSRDYATARDYPADDATSRLSPYLKFGVLHPNQIMARLVEQPAPEQPAFEQPAFELPAFEQPAFEQPVSEQPVCEQPAFERQSGEMERFRAELAWREFYADVLWHDPGSARRAWQPAMRAFRSDHGPDADRLFAAWAAGATGYPLVDAGMRQLLAEGWMHNRMRMITASFLVKDLHLPWERGARHFLTHLVDGDLASNNHGWQWVAGSGTDAAPFFRIFNPVTQSRQFDRDGHYIRRFVPELAGVAGPLVHEPWRLAGGPPAGYPAPVVDHAVEREEALARYGETVRAGSAKVGRPAR